jgi:hypothetical protein
MCSGPPFPAGSMSVSCCAFGLQLEASFPLPGVRDASDPDLPALGVELVDEAELERCWSGDAFEPDWVGLLGDGRELRLERGSAGDRLFTYGERARFHLASDEKTLRCAPAGDGLDWQRALLSKVLPTVSVLRGYEALHASALDTPYGAVALLAPSGTGKTTLALELLARGCELICDDVLVLSTGVTGVLAHPAPPHMNLEPEAAGRAAREGLVQPLACFGEEQWASARQVAVDARPLSAVFLLDRRPGVSRELHALAPSPLRLAPYMLGVRADEGRRRDRFGLYGTLASQAALFELRLGPEDSAQETAGLILHAVEGARSLRAGAA